MNLKTNQKGFTIVELLIVIVVIAILAAISIVAFTGIQQRGRDSQRASDTSNIVKALVAYSADGNTWPADGAAAGTALAGYTTANLSTTVTGKLAATAASSANSSTDDYGYATCSTGTPAAVTGARITYNKESLATGETNPITLTAGRC